jgi:hypothetical protein
MPDDHLPDFKGKQIHIYLSGNSTNSYLIQDATLEMQGGRLFLVGQVSEAYDDHVWGRGKYAAIAWGCIDQYVLFDSEEQYRQEMQRWKAVKAAKAAKDNQRKSIGHWVMSPWSRKQK